VVLADIDDEALAQIADQLTAEGHQVLARHTDVASADEVNQLADATIDRFGAVHVLHNNAGVVAAGPIEQLALETWRWVLDVDLWGPIHGVRSFLPLIERNDWGHIVNTASTCGIQSTSAIAPYNVAKFGVVALSETLAIELQQRRSPVGVSVLIPGAVDTQIATSARSMPAGVRAVHERSPQEDAFLRFSIELLARDGLPPADVAERVLDAIATRRFWVLTHPAWLDVMERRAAAMRDGHLEHGFGG